jgi:hypothetical protein
MNCRASFMLRCMSPEVCWFLDAGEKKAPQAQLTGVQFVHWPDPDLRQHQRFRRLLDDKRTLGKIRT